MARNAAMRSPALTTAGSKPGGFGAFNLRDGYKRGYKIGVGVPG
jgi:hypothetical protein